MKVPVDFFTEEDLLIMSVAVEEFIWSLDEELDSWESYSSFGYDRDDEDFHIVMSMLEDAEALGELIQDALIQEAANV